jgi:hypothetical protein
MFVVEEIIERSLLSFFKTCLKGLGSGEIRTAKKLSATA